MSFAYLALFTGDYLRDTRHLSCSEHGVYLLLLMHCWDSKGPVPLDERKQMGICGARSGDELEALRRVRDEFFIRMEDGYYNPRMQREIERMHSIHNARSNAGKMGYQAKAKQLPKKDVQANARQLLSKSQASAKQLPLTPSPSLTPSSTPENQNLTALSGKPDVLKPEDWDFKQAPKPGEEARYLLAFLNKVANRHFPGVPANLKLLEARLKEATVAQIKHLIADRVSQWSSDPKMVEYLRPKTLFNATNFANYIGELE